MLAVLSTVEVNVGVCCACMPVIYPLLRVLVRHRNKSSTQGFSALEAGYRKESLPPRQQFSQIDEGSNASHVWNSKPQSGNANSSSGSGGGYDDIPLGRIKVTQNVQVERTGVA